MLMLPKNWEQFQHYKKRNPPWIRLYRGLIDNHEFQCLPVASRALAPMLWVLAGEYPDGVFDGSAKILAFRLRSTEKEIEEAFGPLIDAGFFELYEGSATDLLARRKQVASRPLARCNSNATAETETETEKPPCRKAAGKKAKNPPKLRAVDAIFQGGLS